MTLVESPDVLLNYKIIQWNGHALILPPSFRQKSIMLTSDAANISTLLGLYIWWAQYYLVDINQGW